MQKFNLKDIVYLFQPSRYPSADDRYDLIKYKDIKGAAFVCIEMEEGSNFPDHKCGYYVTTTIGFLAKRNWLRDLVHRCDKTEFHAGVWNIF